MSEKKKEELSWGEWFASFWSLPLFLAILCTVVWGWIVWSIAFEPTPFLIFFDGPTPWELFWGGKPNEMGDTLAGLTGVLVMIWVIASTFLQRSELRQARDEYAKMADAMQKQADVADQQIKILKEEQVQRTEQRSSAVYEGLLEQLKDLIIDRSWQDFVWLARQGEYDGLDFVEIGPVFGGFHGDSPPAVYLDQAFRPFWTIARSLRSHRDGLIDEEKPHKLRVFSDFLRAITLLEAQIDLLPADKKLLCKKWKIEKLRELLLELDDEAYWQGD